MLSHKFEVYCCKLANILSGDAASLPLVCWQFVVIQNQFANKTSDPVLTFARGNKIHFYQVNRFLIFLFLFHKIKIIYFKIFDLLF